MTKHTPSCATATAQALALRTGIAIRWAENIKHPTDFLISLVVLTTKLTTRGWDWQNIDHFRQVLIRALTASRDEELTEYLLVVHTAFLDWKAEDNTATANA